MIILEKEAFYEPVHTNDNNFKSFSFSHITFSDSFNEGEKPRITAEIIRLSKIWKKSRKSNLLRSVEGVPIVPVEAKRPSVYKPVIKSGGSGSSKRVLNQGVKRVEEIINPNRLRIIGGVAKGKKINSPDVYLRPMMAKVREAIFSTLDHIGLFNTNTSRVLDMFSGSGSVGLEALSRGAVHTTFVDFSSNCIDTSLNNAQSCGFKNQVSAVCASVEDVLNDPLRFNLKEPYQLISITPPYQEVVYNDLINAVCNSPLVTEGTIVIIEYPEEMGSLPYILGDNKLFGVRNRKYGRTVIAIYVYRPNQKLDMRPDEFVGPIQF
eukprot:gene6232-8587_t